MEQGQQRKLHPVLWVAAVSMTVFSLVGIGAITGVIPTGSAQDKAAREALATAAPAALSHAAASPQVALSSPAEKPIEPAPAAFAEETPVARKSAPKPVAHAPKPRPAPAPVAQYSPPEPAREAAPMPPPAPVAVVCHDCGVVEAVVESEQRGEGSGLGAVAGGVIGGLLGHQVGGGRGKDIATVVGAVAGGVAGNNVERNVKKTPRWEVVVRFNDGTTRSFNQSTPPAWRAGDKVKLVNGVLAGA